MIVRRVLAGLLALFAVLLVSLAVLMGFHLLAEGLGDAALSLALRWSARVCLVLLVIDTVLLVLVLGVKALNE